MTLEEIAEKLNVSISSISRVINNKPGVNSEKRLLIKNFLTENKIINSNDNNNIVIIIPDFENPFFGEIIKESSRMLLKAGFQVSIYDTDENPEIEKSVVKNIIRNGAAGVIFCISDEDMSTKHVNMLQDSRIPVILFDRELDSHLEGVFLNDFQSGYLATEELIAKKCKNIAIIKGPKNLNHINNRYKGYKYALNINDINLREDIVFHGDMKTESGYDIMKEIVEKNYDVDGILILNNFMTIGALNYIINTDQKLYDKYMIFGYDIPEYVHKLNPKINIVTRSRKEMGRLIGEMMLDKLKGNTGHSKKIIIEPIIM